MESVDRDPQGVGGRSPIRAMGAALVVGAVGLMQIGCQGERREADGASAEPTAGTIQAYVMDGAPGADAAVGAQGSFLGNFIISVYSPEGIWVDLGRRAEMTVPLSSAQPYDLLESLEIPPGTYNRVRILVCHSSADVDPGSTVAGAIVEEPSHVHLTETGDIYILRDVEPFQVTSTDPIRLDIDLNSSGWITQEALASGVASIPTFEEQVQVRVRGGDAP